MANPTRIARSRPWGPQYLISLLLLVDAVHGSQLESYVDLGPPSTPVAGREILIQHYSPGYVILSVFLAVVGAACTLELLIRRTSNHGMWNTSLLVSSGFAFGSVSCFALHFIGNQALTLRRPASDLHPHPRALTLAYNPGFTILSLVVSVTVTCAAFFVMGLDFEGLEWNGTRIQRRRGPVATERKVEGKDTDGKDDAKKWKKGALEGGMSRTEKIKDSKVWRTLEGAMAWTTVDLGERSSKPTPSSFGLPSDKNRIYAAEERERGVGLGTGEDVGSAGDEDWAGRRRRSSGRRQAEEGYGVELSPRSRGGIAVPSSPRASEEVIADDSSSSGCSRRASAPSIHQSPTRTSSFFSPGFSLDPPPSTTVGRSFANPTTPSPLPITVDQRSSSESIPPGFEPAPPSRALDAFPIPTASTSALLPNPPPPSPSPRYPPPAASPSPLHRTSINLLPSLPSPPLPLSSSDPPTPSAIAYPITSRRASIPATFATTTRSIGRIEGGEMTFEEFEATESGQREWIRESVSATSGLPPLDRRRPSALDPDHAANAGAGGEPMLGGSDGWNSKEGSRGKDEEERVREEEYFPHHLGKDDKALERSESSVTVNSKLKKGQWSSLRRGFGFVLGDVTKIEMTKVVCAGTVAGFGIAGMHYIGQRSINSIPYISYSPFLVALSVVLACLSVIAGLWTMFLVLKPKLRHSWLKKFGVACVLGSGTSLMHYTAMLGTTYMVDIDVDLPDSAIQGQTRIIITALVACLAVLACSALIISVIVAQRRLLSNKSRRRRVVIASAIWDESSGHVLVSPDGMLPLADIGSLESTDGAVGLKSSDRVSAFVDGESVTSSVLDIDLVPSHPAFVASLRSTWFWRQPGAPPPVLLQDRPAGFPNSTASHDLDSMEEMRHGQSLDFPHSRRGSTVDGIFSGTTSVGGHSGVAAEGSVARFLDRFSSAVAQLALEVTGNVQGTRRLGVLYDRILTTGFITFYTNASRRSSRQRDTVSKGQMVFLTNSCTPGERGFYTRRGFTFAAPTSVARVMASTLAVPVEDMNSFLVDLHSFAVTGMKPVVQPGKIYAGVSLAQALPFEGLRIVVDSKVRHSLPMREFGDVPPTGHVRLTSDRGQGIEPIDSLEELGEVVASFAGSSLLSMMDPSLNHSRDSDTPLTSSSRVRIAIVDAIVPLLDRVPRSVMRDVLRDLVIIPSIIPLTPPLHSHDPLRLNSSGRPPSYLIVFKAILPSTIDFSDLGPAWSWQSFRLFRAQNESVARDGLGLAEYSSDPMDVASASTLGVSVPTMDVFRRPSKVQWSTPLGFPSSEEISPTRPETVPQSPPTELFSLNGYSFPPLSSSSSSSNPPASPSTLSAYAPPTASVPENSEDPLIASDDVPAHLPSSFSAVVASRRLSRRPADLVLSSAQTHPLNSIYDPPSVESEVQPIGIRSWNPMWLVEVIREGER
ncbi:hypothetical protein BDY24DRAFT_445093 [Mrakia frigida]|uniref:uncharacterized protein n=1 Tax=Mrakia frigida TaxID=29902 RepID=UPI003FCC0170